MFLPLFSLEGVVQCSTNNINAHRTSASVARRQTAAAGVSVMMLRKVDLNFRIGVIARSRETLVLRVVLKGRDVGYDVVYHPPSQTTTWYSVDHTQLFLILFSTCHVPLHPLLGLAIMWSFMWIRKGRRSIRAAPHMEKQWLSQELFSPVYHNRPQESIIWGCSSGFQLAVVHCTGVILHFLLDTALSNSRGYLQAQGLFYSVVSGAWILFSVSTIRNDGGLA